MEYRNIYHLDEKSQAYSVLIIIYGRILTLALIGVINIFCTQSVHRPAKISWGYSSLSSQLTNKHIEWARDLPECFSSLNYHKVGDKITNLLLILFFGVRLLIVVSLPICIRISNIVINYMATQDAERRGRESQNVMFQLRPTT